MRQPEAGTPAAIPFLRFIKRFPFLLRRKTGTRFFDGPCGKQFTGSSLQHPSASGRSPLRPAHPKRAAGAAGS